MGQVVSTTIMNHKRLLCVMELRWGVMIRVIAVAKKNIRNVVENKFLFF
jgi:hypothetical protein